MKTCTRCGISKPRSEFGSNKRSREGLLARCKECTSAWHRANYLAKREVRLAQSRAWYAANKERRAAVSRAYYEANKEQYAERQRQWMARNPGGRARLVREWRAANPELSRSIDRAWRAANAEKVRASERAAYAANPEPHIERQHRRRALIAGSAVGPVDLNALWTGECGLCGDPLDREVRHPDPMSKSLDHIIPLSRGGGHVQGNLQWTHLVCNVSKGARLPD